MPKEKAAPPAAVTHEAPRIGESRLPCCGRDPLDLPATEAMTVHPERVDCGRKP